MTRHLLATLAALALAACAAQPIRTADPVADAAAVKAAETSFAKSMADRDFAAFSAHVADDAIFTRGGEPLTGKAAVLGYWKKFFEGDAAPFAWKPAFAVSTGGLGYTEGPVTNPEGKEFARFHSTWRRDPDGRWRVVFDDGHLVCDCTKK